MEGLLLDEFMIGGFKAYILVRIKIDSVSLTLVYHSLQRPPVGFIIPRCFPDKCDNDDDECNKECIVPLLSDDAISFDVIKNCNNWIRVAPLYILPGDIYEKVKNLVIVELVKKVKLEVV